jgi:glucosamine--fructose-6-phosphate aminotransferase (isomerizing)
MTLERLSIAYSSGQHHRALQSAAKLLAQASTPACLTGMGASYFALFAPKAIFDRAGVPARLEETGYLVEYGLASLRRGQPVVLVSQSGRSAEATRLAAELGPDNPLILVTNDPNTSLATRAQIVLPLLAEPDLSVALKTYTATVALLLMLATDACGGSGSQLRTSFVNSNPMGFAISRAEQELAAIVEFAGAPDYVPVLGRGPSLASALGGGLLLKETAKLPADGADAAQFRHGAVEVVRPGMLTVLFSPPGKSTALNLSLAAELESYGARVLLIGEKGLTKPSRSRLVVETELKDEYVAPVFEIVPMQLLSHALARKRGIDAGSFVNTVPVITTA